MKGRLKIYFEDKDLIVVEKPANMIAVSHKDGRGGSKGKTLMDDVRAYMRRKHREAAVPSSCHCIDWMRKPAV